MDKVIIIGIYDFLGFHLCLEFLEQGLEVIGIETETDESDMFIEEKKLLIGRNSNLTIMDWPLLLKEKELGYTPMIIDYYSNYVMEQEGKLLSALEHYSTGLEVARMAVLLPLQLYGKEGETKPRFLQTIEKDGKIQSSFFYLPSVYGPWQPSVFALQQSLNGAKEITVSQREWTEDAIFIGDAVAVIARTMENWEKENKKYIIRSMFEDHWQQIIGRDPMPQSEKAPLFVAEKDCHIIHAGKTEPSVGVKKQQEHLSALLRKNDHDFLQG